MLTTTLRSGWGVVATWLEVIRWLGAFAMGIVPRVRVELGRWEQMARRVPDPTLRRHALDGLHEKRSNAEAAAVFSILSPRPARGDVVALLVALQVLTDYLDTVSEAAVAEPLRNSLALHEALVDAVGGGAPSSDYYRRHPQRDDGGYVAELVTFCQQRLRALPALDAVQPFVGVAARRCAAGQSYTHAAIHGRSDELKAWAVASADGTGYRWWEVAAGASSSVAVHALVASAADRKTTTEEARRVDAMYCLSVGSLTVLLDNLADRSADLAAGAHNYLGYYASVEDAAGRLAAISTLAATSPRRGRRARRHAAILAGVLGFYLSAPDACTGYGRVVRAQVLAARVPAVRLVSSAMRTRRAVSVAGARPTAPAARRAGSCSRRGHPGSS